MVPGAAAGEEGDRPDSASRGRRRHAAAAAAAADTLLRLPSTLGRLRLLPRLTSPDTPPLVHREENGPKTLAL